LSIPNRSRTLCRRCTERGSQPGIFLLDGTGLSSVRGSTACHSPCPGTCHSRRQAVYKGTDPPPNCKKFFFGAGFFIFFLYRRSTTFYFPCCSLSQGGAYGQSGQRLSRIHYSATQRSYFE